MVKMKKILIISTHTERDEQILDAIKSASEKNGAETLSLSDLLLDYLKSSNFSITQSIFHLIELSDLVVAYIKDYNPNLFYEIGLAHGLGKHVVIISDKYFRVPADLINQKIVILSSDLSDKCQNIFTLEKLFDQLLYEKGAFGFQTPTEEVKNIEASNSEIGYKLKDLLWLNGSTRHEMFEKWFFELVQGIPEWEIIQAPPVDKGYDFVIWNGYSDNELNILGNPIPVELKAGKNVSKDTIKKLVDNALLQGIKGVILPTTASRTRSIDAYIKKIYEEKRFVVIFLELDDLLKVKSPRDFIEIIKSKLFSLVYGVDDCV
ncbi:MAG: hypothetical protein ACYDEF_14525 [Methanosarcina sp.]